LKRSPGYAAVVLASVLTWVAGCAVMPPRSVPPTLPGSVPLAAAPTAGMTGTQAFKWPEREWWRSFGDATLNELIARALTNSPDLAAATARIGAARAAVDSAAAGSRFHAGFDASAAESHQ
jgi:outer membrane protein TolC